MLPFCVTILCYHFVLPFCVAILCCHFVLLVFLYFHCSGAMVDFEGRLNHTPLHYSSSAGHVDITAMLLKHNANPMKKNTKKQTPYHLAFKNDRREILDMLTEALPSSVKPYCLKGTYHSESEQIVTSMGFISLSEEEMKLATGSRDCLVSYITILCFSPSPLPSPPLSRHTFLSLSLLSLFPPPPLSLFTPHLSLSFLLSLSSPLSLFPSIILQFTI